MVLMLMLMLLMMMVVQARRHINTTCSMPTSVPEDHTRGILLLAVAPSLWFALIPIIVTHLA